MQALRVCPTWISSPLTWLCNALVGKCMCARVSYCILIVKCMYTYMCVYACMYRSCRHTFVYAHINIYIPYIVLVVPSLVLYVERPWRGFSTISSVKDHNEKKARECFYDTGEAESIICVWVYVDWRVRVTHVLRAHTKSTSTCTIV